MTEEETQDLLAHPCRGPWDTIPRPGNHYLFTIEYYTVYTMERLTEMYRAVDVFECTGVRTYFQRVMALASEAYELEFVRDVCRAVLAACVRDIFYRKETP